MNYVRDGTKQSLKVIDLNNMKLKTEINLWSVEFIDTTYHLTITLKSVFNSGFIDDVDTIKAYFNANNDKYQLINIEKL